MTSATDELRRLLDERGVEWRERVWGGKHSVTTFWHARGVRWHYRENRFGELLLHADGLAPEQAVAATLGPGTCHIDLVGYSQHEDRFQCRSCDWSMSVRRGTWPRFNYCPNCGRRVVD